MFEESQPAVNVNLKKAIEDIKHFRADMFGNEEYKVL